MAVSTPASTPVAHTTAPRAHQCAEHVTRGLRAIAQQVMMLEEHVHRSNDEKRSVQSCVLDSSRSWKDCLEPDEVAEVERYGVQRQKECESWAPELAACVLRLPEAKNCDHDSEPLWRLPNEEGPPGPTVAWSIDVEDDDDSNNDVHFAWIAGGTLVVRDDRGVRALVDGKERWKLPAAGMDSTFEIVGGWLVTRNREAPNGVTLVKLTTGARASAAQGEYFQTIGTAGDRVVALTSDDTLFELTPARCAKTPKSCATKLGKVEHAIYAEALIGWQGTIGIASSAPGLIVVDRKGRKRQMIRYEASDLVLTKDSAVIATDNRIVELAPAGCASLGDFDLDDTDARGCVIAQHPLRSLDHVTAAALSDGAIAYNDEALIQKTHYFTRSGAAWDAKTGARGGLAGDATNVYVVSFGLDRDGPVRLLALSRATGKAAWQTDLPGADAKASSVELAVRDGLLAVRVGGKLYVMKLT